MNEDDAPSLLERLSNLRPSEYGELPLEEWIEWFVRDLLVANFRPFFQAVKQPVEFSLELVDQGLQAVPFPIFVIVLALIAWRTAGRGLAIFTVASLVLIDWIDVWEEMITTLSMVLTSVMFCAVIGIPLGIVAARSEKFATGIRPVLDIMQTIPPFVYLVPIVMLFGVGIVPGVIATVVFALPPIVRLTNLGIRQVQDEMVEAGYAFGATRRQVLFNIELPLALRTIMAGLNQTLMLALSMVVIAALIGAGGLGFTVFTGLGRLDIGRAFLGGLGIVLIAIILDRITQALGRSASERQAGWRFRDVLRGLFRGRERGERDTGDAQPAPSGAD